MTALDTLKAQAAALVKRQEEARAKERATQAKIRTNSAACPGPSGKTWRPRRCGRPRGAESRHVATRVWISGDGWHHGYGTPRLGYTANARRREGRVMTTAQLSRRLRRRLSWGLLRGGCRVLVTLGYLISVLSLIAWALGAPGSVGLGVASLVLAAGLQAVWGWGLFRD